MKIWKWFIRINQILFYSQGRWGHTFLFLRKHLKFTTIQYTTYTTILGIIGLLGQYILVPILSGSYTFLRSYKLFNWKLHDSTISLLDATTRFEKYFFERLLKILEAVNLCLEEMKDQNIWQNSNFWGGIHNQAEIRIYSNFVELHVKRLHIYWNVEWIFFFYLAIFIQNLFSSFSEIFPGKNKASSIKERKMWHDQLLFL